MHRPNPPDNLNYLTDRERDLLAESVSYLIGALDGDYAEREKIGDLLDLEQKILNSYPFAGKDRRR